MSFISAIPIIGSAIDAIVGNSQSQLEAQVARENTDKTIQANKDLAKQAYEQNVQMWNLQNQYNSPQSQMERYKAAGLNPQLAVGGGNPGNAGGIPSYQAPRVDYNYKAYNPAAGLAGKLTEFMSFKMQQAQLQNLESAGQGIQLDNASKAMQNAALSKAVNIPGGPQYNNMVEAMNMANLQKVLTQENVMREMFPYQRDALKSAALQRDATVNKLLEDTIFRRYENQWMRSGVTRSDNPLLRLGVRAANAFGWQKYFDPNKLK